MNSKIARTWGLFRTFVIAYGIPGWKLRLRKLYSHFITPGMLCFDIGSHYGNRIPIWLGLGARVVAIEPQDELMGFLKRWYGHAANVTLINGVVGKSDGKIVLYHNTLNPSLSTTDASWIEEKKADSIWGKYKWDASVEVSSFRLDSLIQMHGVPDFCKIDVEGAELEVLQSLSHPVGIISFEYLTISRDRAVSCIDRISELGNYEFNWTLSEFSKLLSPKWLDATQMKHAVLRMAEGTYSGDIYARRIP